MLQLFELILKQQTVHSFMLPGRKTVTLVRLFLKRP